MYLHKSRLWFLLLLLLSTPLFFGQTFRGGIAGSVTDTSGAVVPGVKITLLNPETGLVRDTISTGGGDYAFQDLPLGNHYVITVNAAGFQSTRITEIAVHPGQVYSLPIKLTVASTTQTVEVNAADLALDTVSSTNAGVVPDKAVQNIPLNGRDFTQLLKIVPGYNGYGSLNGTRTNQNNWQIDGADNNDLWHNSQAANQGGVSGIAGVTLPIDAIDQFSVQTQGNAEVGRNGGGLINMVVRSGTNNFHGSAYYFLRNEFFAEQSPFVTGNKPKIRNNQFGASLGGPILRDKLFFFLNYERQKYVVGNQSSATEPTTAWVDRAEALLADHNVPISQTMLNVLSLWPQGNKSGAATVSNYYETRPQTGYSDNTILKLDYNLTSKQTLSVRGFVGAGRQTGNAGTNVYDYYQIAPDHVQNYAITHNWTPTAYLSNQIVFAANYFGQTFNDAVHNQNVPALGLDTGVTNASLYGAPTITITGFDQIGVTQPLGRKDVTGHVTDTVTYVVGKHQFRFGGEYRRSYMDLLYQRNVRGSFDFTGTSSSALVTGTATSYANDSSQEVYGSSDYSVRALADFLAGFAADGTIVRGNLQRDLWVNTFDVFAQDQYQLLPRLTLNFGLRYDFNGPFYSTDGTLSNFDPNSSTGFAIVGQGLDSIYPRNWTNFSPRFGFSSQLTDKFVVRGTYGVFFDLPNLNGFFDNRPGNGGSVGVQANRAGSDPVFTVSNSSPFAIVTDVDPLPSSNATTTFGAATVSKDFRTAYIQNFNLNTEYQLSPRTIVQVGYVGSLGRRLFNLRDINQAATGTSVVQSSRPYYGQFPALAAINQFESSAGSNYHSLQAQIRTSGWHGLTAQASYTYGHALDNVSATRGYAPQDSNNLAAEYGNALFDVKHTFNGYIVYEVPTFTEHAKLLTKGWQANSFLTFYTGSPVNVKLSNSNSGNGEKQDRVNLIGKPYASSHAFNSTGLYVPWFDSSAFSTPAAGTYGTMQRDLLRGPGFGTVDAALVKNTGFSISSKELNLQLRAEMFNIFNRVNLANPSGTFGSSSFGRSTDTQGDNNGAPGIGPGEPFNVQFAAKLIF